MYTTYLADKKQESRSWTGSINNRDLAGQRNKSVQKNTSIRGGAAALGRSPLFIGLSPVPNS